MLIFKEANVTLVGTTAFKADVMQWCVSWIRFPGASAN